MLFGWVESVAFGCSMSNDHRLMSMRTPTLAAVDRIAFTPSMWDCVRAIGMPLES